MMVLFLKRWRLLVALIAAITITMATATTAFAAEPGEGNTWTDDMTNGSPIQSQDTAGEAYGGNTGTLVTIWRGNTDNHVWVAVDHGAAFGLGSSGNPNTTLTYVAPRVIYSNGWFYAFHTGTDGNIYWSRAYDTTIGASTPSASRAYNWSNWTAITGNTTNQSVSLASSSSGLLMTYRGSGNNTALYSAWLQAGSDVFNPAQAIGNVNSNSAPVVSFSSMFNTFTLVFRGLLDNRVYRMAQVLGQSTWSDPIALTGVTTDTSPVIANDSDGNELVAAVDDNGVIHFEAIDSLGVTTGWSTESVGVITAHPVFLSLAGGIFYILATLTADNGDYVQWKPAWNPT